MKNYKTSLILILTEIYLLVVTTLLTLAINQAIFLTGLYRVSASPSPATDYDHLRGLSFSYDLLILAIVAMVLFLLVRDHPRRLLPVSIIAVLVFVALNLHSGQHLLPQLFIWPAPTSLAERYTQALAANNLEAALRLTDQSEACKTIMAQVFRKYQAQLTQKVGNDRPKMSFQSVSVKSCGTRPFGELTTFAAGY